MTQTGKGGYGLFCLFFCFFVFFGGWGGGGVGGWGGVLDLARTCKVYLRDGSAQTNVRAATLR